MTVRRAGLERAQRDAGTVDMEGKVVAPCGWTVTVTRRQRAHRSYEKCLSCSTIDTVGSGEKEFEPVMVDRRYSELTAFVVIEGKLGSRSCRARGSTTTHPPL